MSSSYTERSEQFDIAHAEAIILADYSESVSVTDKKKSLLKFGVRTTVGTTWETLTTTVGSQLQETFETDNLIDTVVSSAAGDNGKTLKLEYHTISGGETTFAVQDITLDGTNATTPVSLTVPAFRTNRMYNTSSSALTGNIYVYKDNSGRDDDKTHLVIPAGEQQTQKAATTISSNDYWIITNISLSVLSKTSAYAEARLETKPVTGTYWRPVTQNFSCKDSSGTVQIRKRPFVIVPKNYDVRLAVRTNAGSVDVAGGFSGYLASVL